MGIFTKGRQETAAKVERLRKERAEAERLAAIADSERPPRPPKPSKDDFVKAEYGVPHCKFERTEEGFKVNFNRASLNIHSGLNNAVGAPNKGLAPALGGLLSASLIGAVALAQKAGSGTNIEVTRDAVIIDGKKLARKDFGHFNVGKTWKGSSYSSTLAVLGYRYGIRNFEFGGAWSEGEATEVASALNDHLRETPMAGDDDQVSPEMLRVARPTDF